MRVLVIIPAFNEERNLPALLTRLRAFHPLEDVCVVDDGSSDGTFDVARRAGAVALRSPLNLGIGGAVQTGYLWASRNDYDAAVQIDGDGQHDPEYLAAVLEPLRSGKADVVVGSRFLGAGGFQSTLVRRAGIRYLTHLIRFRCGTVVTDPTSGFRAAGRKAISLYAQRYPSDYPEPEAIALARRSGLVVQEVPVRMQERVHGESSINAWKTLYYLVKVSLALLLLPPRRA